MLVAVISILLCALLLAAALAAVGLLKDRTFAWVIMGGYVLRFVLQLFVIREVQFFSHFVGGDSIGYEIWSRAIVKIWERTDIHFVTGDELDVLGATSLPCNLFALIGYIDDGPTFRYACTAVVALAAGLSALNVYLLAVQFGAQPKRAALFASILYMQPAVLFYTSDMYKDGLVLLFVMGALGSSLRLSQRFSLLDAVVGVLSLWALWYVRFYLIFVCIAPLIVGLIGLRAKGFARSLLVSIFLLMIVLGLSSFTNVMQLASERASETFATGTSLTSLQANAEGGSGVLFDDGGSPYGALGIKLLYTVFSPFPWANGSIGFHLGKLDAFIWYFVIYCAFRACFRVDRSLAIMLSTFLIPCTVMYAMSMANVGLIVRQRLVIVAATMILAATYTPKRTMKKVSTPSRAVTRATALRKMRAT